MHLFCIGTRSAKSLTSTDLLLDIRIFKHSQARGSWKRQGTWYFRKFPDQANSESRSYEEALGTISVTGPRRTKVQFLRV